MSTSVQAVAVTRTDGSVAMMYFALEGRSSTLPSGARWLVDGVWRRGATNENVSAEISKARIENVVGFQLVGNENLPSDRIYRNAWVVANGKVIEDLQKSKEIHRDIIRRVREPLFVANDLAMRDAMAAKDDVALAAAVARRDQLRDAPADPRIEAAQSVEDLKQIRVT